VSEEPGYDVGPGVVIPIYTLVNSQLDDLEFPRKANRKATFGADLTVENKRKVA
jgi:hypothetical protein